MANNEALSEISELKLIIEQLDMLPNETKSAVEFFTKILSEKMSSVLSDMKNKLIELNTSQESSSDISCSNDNEYYIISYHIILRYCNIMVDLFKEEINCCCILQETRNWALLRIISCLEKFKAHRQKTLGSHVEDIETSISNNIGSCDGDEFITWVDDTLDLQDFLSKLFQDNYENSNIQNEETKDISTWKNEDDNGGGNIY